MEYGFSMLLKRGVERGDGGLEPHLVVALAGATVGNAGRSVLMGDIHQMGGDERTGKSGEQRVLVLIHGVRRDGPGEVLVSELIGHVDDLDGDAAERTGLVGDLLQAVVLLAHVAEHGDHVEIQLVL